MLAEPRRRGVVPARAREPDREAAAVELVDGPELGVDELAPSRRGAARAGRAPRSRCRARSPPGRPAPRAPRRPRPTSALAAHAAISACSSAEFATRRSRLANRSSSTSSGAADRLEHAPRERVRRARTARRGRRVVAKIPNGARRGTTFPVRISIPARSIVSHGSVATSEVSAPRSADVDVLAAARSARA